MPPNNESTCPRCAEYERAFRTMRGNVDDGDTVGSVPASAWDIICKDRDEWKRRALKAEENAERLYATGELRNRPLHMCVKRPSEPNSPESPDGSPNDSESPKGST